MWLSQGGDIKAYCVAVLPFLVCSGVHFLAWKLGFDLCCGSILVSQYFSAIVCRCHWVEWHHPKNIEALVFTNLLQMLVPQKSHELQIKWQVCQGSWNPFWHVICGHMLTAHCSRTRVQASKIGQHYSKITSMHQCYNKHSCSSFSVLAKQACSCSERCSSL